MSGRRTAEGVSRPAKPARQTCRRILLLLAAGGLVGCVGLLVPEGELLRHVYLRGARDVPAVALTFDDGPNGRCTEEVLDALREVAAPATFFVIGASVERGESDGLLMRMVHEGHEVGLHSNSHGVRPLLFQYLTREELEDARAAVETALGRAGVQPAPPIRFFRPPFGFLTAASARAAGDAGLAIVEWTVSVRDWHDPDEPDAIVARVLARVEPGDVIVLHDGAEAHQRSHSACVDRPRTAEVVRQLVPALVARGLHVVPLGGLLGFDAPAPSRVDATQASKPAHEPRFALTASPSGH